MVGKILISNIQRFSLHDGPGIRTTIFIKGCSLHCPWCANPENISHSIENYVTPDGVSGAYGRWYDCDELYHEAIKDKLFYSYDGGVTFSGGEPLLQIEYMEELLTRLRAEKIHQCIETALFVPKTTLLLAVKYIDLFIVDIKIMDARDCESTLGGKLETYRQNIDILKNNRSNVLFRLPMISPFTTNQINLEQIADFLVQMHDTPRLELIKGHNLAKKKYDSLGKEMYYTPDLSDGQLKKTENFFESCGIKTKICRV